MCSPLLFLADLFSKKVPQYYLLVDNSNYVSWFRVPANDFETMFEPICLDKDCYTYQFNNETKKKARESVYWSLDTYICECEFNHVRSDWRTSSEPFKVKAVYYWHNNIYN